jgi:hypothetical protein
MGLNPQIEFSDTQREIVKLIPVVEHLISEESPNNGLRIKEYKRFLADLMGEYRWLERRIRNYYIESTGEQLTKYTGNVKGTQRALTEPKVISWYAKFRKYYEKEKDPRIIKVLCFLKFKYRQIIVHTHGINWVNPSKSPQGPVCDPGEPGSSISN